MNKILKASDEVKKLHKMFQALGDVVEVLDNVGSLEQAEAEAKARIAKISQDVEEARLKIDEANKKAEQIVTDSQAKAEQLLLSAEESARQLIADADIKVSQANASADAILATAKLGVDNCTQECAEIKARHDAFELEVVELEKRSAKAKAYLAKLAG